jgi:hypothetical protein
MTTDERPSGLLLPLLLLGVLLLLISLVAVAALVPVFPCPSESGPSEDMNPCVHCNGHGRSTMFQQWYYLRYRRDLESTYITL